MPAAGYFYSTETEIFYVSPGGRCWLVASAEGSRRPREVDGLPAGSVRADAIVEEAEAAEWIRLIAEAPGPGVLP